MHKLTACPRSIRKCNILLLICPLHGTIYQEVHVHACALDMRQCKMIKLYIVLPVTLVISQRSPPTFTPCPWIMFMSLIGHLSNHSSVQAWESQGAQKGSKIGFTSLQNQECRPRYLIHLHKSKGSLSLNFW